jgi:two-component system KDP operon response regulator KdpE
MTSATSEPPPATRILVVEDDPNIVDLIRSNLAVRGFETIVSTDGARALELLETERPDIILLDLMLPAVDGFELCKQVRERSGVGVIVVSARGGDRDKVAALNLGADDYMTKPFSIEELLARIAATLRRTRPALGPETPQTRIALTDDLEMDLASQQVTRNGKELHLTPTEFLQPRQAPHPRPTPAARLGSRLRDRNRVRPRLRAPPAGKVGARGQSAVDPHAASRRLPARSGVNEA